MSSGAETTSVEWVATGFVTLSFSLLHPPGVDSLFGGFGTGTLRLILVVSERLSPTLLRRSSTVSSVSTQGCPDMGREGQDGPTVPDSST